MYCMGMISYVVLRVKLTCEIRTESHGLTGIARLPQCNFFHAPTELWSGLENQDRPIKIDQY